MPGLHAKLSASGSHRWINCPGSVKAEEGIKDKTSPFAQWGTACHELSELCLLSGEHADAHLNKEVAGVTVDDEMVTTAQSYIDYVNSYRNTHSLQIEKRVDFSEWVPGGFGTCDCIAISLTGDDLVIIDLKGGKGVRVDAENNTQLMLYALGALAEYDYLIEPEKVKMVIVQPRLDHVSEWEIPTSELLAHPRHILNIWFGRTQTSTRRRNLIKVGIQPTTPQQGKSFQMIFQSCHLKEILNI